MLKQKPNQFVLPITFILIFVLLVFGLLLTRVVLNMIFNVSSEF